MTGPLVVSVPLPPLPGARTVAARVLASMHGRTVLWEDARAPAGADGPGRTWVLLDIPPSEVPTVFRRPLRFVSVRCRPDSPWSPAVPVSGAGLLHAGRFARLEERVSALEATVAAADLRAALGEQRDGIDDHEQRLRALEGHEALSRLEQRARDLARRLDRLDGDEGRLVRLEDELEDLVGPDGDVVDFEARLSTLERGAGPSCPPDGQDPGRS